MIKIRVHWFQALLDQNVLECIKFWLEPLTDGSLPSLDIQLNMMNLLKKVFVVNQDAY